MLGMGDSHVWPTGVSSRDGWLSQLLWVHQPAAARVREWYAYLR